MSVNPKYKKSESQGTARENELSLANYSLGSFFVESPAGFGLFDLDCRCVRLNKTLADLGDVTIEQTLNRKVSEVLPQPMADHVEKLLRQVIASGTPKINTTFSCISLDRPELIRHWKASIFPVFNDLGTISGVGVQVVEATELRQTQVELARQEIFHRTVLESIPARIFMKDCAGNYIYCNEALASDAGLAQDEIIGKNDYDLFRPDLAVRYRQGDLEVITTGRIEEFDYRFEKNGSDYYIHVIKAPVVDDEGKMLGIIGLFQDLTENKQAERQLHISHQALDSTLAGVAITNLEGQLTYVNPSFVKMWGYDNDQEILGRPATEFWTNPASAREVIEELHTKGQWQGEMTGFRKDGSILQALLAGNIVRDERGLIICLLCSFIDVTVRKEFEKRLLESKKRYRQITDHIDDAVWVYDTSNNKVLYVNPAYEAIWGRPRELLYRDSMDWLEAIHPADRRRMVGVFKEIGAVKKNHYRIIRSDGNIRHIYARIFPIVDEKGRVYREAGIAQDVTEARVAETKIRNLSRRLLKVAEEERKGIARDLHDEFGQVLINLRQCYKDLLDLAPEAPSVTARAGELNDLIERMGAIISNTTHHLRPDILDNLGLVSALKATVSDFEKHWPATSVTLKIKGRPSPIDPDHALVLYRVLQEGLTNIARHAKAENVEIRLIFSFPTIIMSIRDDGGGFVTDQFGEDENSRRGLGLRGIVERISAINGLAKISSKPGKGTTLRVEIVSTPQHTKSQKVP